MVPLLALLLICSIVATAHSIGQFFLVPSKVVFFINYSYVLSIAIAVPFILFLSLMPNKKRMEECPVCHKVVSFKSYRPNYGSLFNYLKCNALYVRS